MMTDPVFLRWCHFELGMFAHNVLVHPELIARFYKRNGNP